MALFCRIKEVKPNNIIHHFKRYYFHISVPGFANRKASQRVSDYYYCYYLTNRARNQAICQRREELFNNRVRLFAAPVQVKKKEEVSNQSRPRLNSEIQAEFMRLVTDEGHTVVSRNEALRRAMNLKLDLVEVDRNAKPPVCKIMDYKREQYKKQVKEKERAKIKSVGSLKKGDCKEVRFSAKTELKDLKMKADTVKRMMERGYRVKCTATGAEDQDLTGLLSQLSAMIEDVAFMELGPKMEKRQAYFIVRHVKFGPSKKVGNKASKIKSATSSETQQEAAICSDSRVDTEEETFSEESGMDDDEVKTPLQGQDETSWSASSVSSAKQNFDNMLHFSQGVKGTSSSHAKKMRSDTQAASSPTNNSGSRFSPSREPNFSAPNVRPPLQEPENRYARNVTKNASALRNTVKSPYTANSPQPQSNVHPSGAPRQTGSEGFLPRNFQVPQNEVPQPRGEIPNHARHSDVTRNSQSMGFGIFSHQKADASGKHGSGFEVNHRDSDSPSTVTRNSRPSMVPGDLDTHTSKSDGRHGSDDADSRKWGIFSK